MADAPDADVTRDSFLGGRLVLEQPRKGHRAGTDAVLLAAAAPRGFAGRVYDVGAGVGSVGLSIALTSPEAAVTLVERDTRTAALAQRNAAANGLDARVGVATCDLLCREARRASLPDPADLVVTNPPFFQAGEVRVSPDDGRRAAHVFDAGADLEAWLLACLSLLAPKGTLILVHSAHALPELLRFLNGPLGALKLMAIHPRPEQPASRILLRGRKGSRAPFEIAPPFVLHDGDRFTSESEKLHSGASGLNW